MLLPYVTVALLGFAARAPPLARVGCVAAAASPRALRTAAPPEASTTAASRRVVVTDMDETLISKKSTGYIIKFLFMYHAYVRLFCFLWIGAILIPISKVSRTFAVRVLYFMAFRGLKVERAEKVAAELLPKLYVSDLQDPATSAVLEADEAVVLTASPEFMARPWLGQYLGVPAANVYGAQIGVRNGRFTGVTGDLPIGQKKVELLRACAACAEGEGVEVTGYGDHPTDVPFLEACGRGVLVHELPPDVAGSCEYEPASTFDASRLEARPAAA